MVYLADKATLRVVCEVSGSPVRLPPLNQQPRAANYYTVAFTDWFRSVVMAVTDATPAVIFPNFSSQPPPSYITVYLTLGMHDRTRWAFKLAPQLTGRAQQAYAALDPSNAECYNMVKVAILRCYNINDETYCQRFRTLKFKAGKTPTEIAMRLTDLAGRWLKHCHTVEEVKDTVVKEQLLITFPEDVRMWVKERKPKTTGEAAQLAEDYFQARQQGTQKSDTVLIVPNDPCLRCGENGHWARHCPTNPKPSATRPPQTAPTNEYQG